MEQFDKKLHDSKQQVKLRNDLVANIMQKIRLMPTPKKRSIQWSRQTYIWASAPILLLSIVAVSFLTIGARPSSVDHSATKSKSNSTSVNDPKGSNNSASSNSVKGSKNDSSSKSSTASTNIADNGSVANGTDNVSLNSDINNISSSLNENDQSFAAVTDAINNQQLDNTPSTD